MDGRAGSYSTASIALPVTESHKPHHQDKVETPLGEQLFLLVYFYTSANSWNQTQDQLFLHSSKQNKTKKKLSMNQA
jgi:hypothetical protein